MTRVGERERDGVWMGGEHVVGATVEVDGRRCNWKNRFSLFESNAS